MTFPPYFWNERDGEQISTHVKSLVSSGNLIAGTTTSILNSSLFYWWFILLSNSRDLSLREIESFPVGIENMPTSIKEALSATCQHLMDDLKENAFRKTCYYKATGKVIYDEYYPSCSKPIIDEIDRVLAKHYGFTDEELDFIINYDIKYRMGQDAEGEED